MQGTSILRKSLCEARMEPSTVFCSSRTHHHSIQFCTFLLSEDSAIKIFRHMNSNTTYKSRSGNCTVGPTQISLKLTLTVSFVLHGSHSPQQTLRNYCRGASTKVMFLFLYSPMYITTSHSLLHWLSQLRCRNKILQASLWHKFSYTANSWREQEGLSLNLDKVGKTCRIPAGCRRGRTTAHLQFFMALFGKKKKAPPFKSVSTSLTIFSY